LRIRFETKLPLSSPVGVRDLIVLQGLFGNEGSFCAQILEELANVTAIPPEKLIIPLHKGCHVGTTYQDLDTWEQECSTLSKVMRTLAQGFNMTVAASRVNLYRGFHEWKPFHHDAHAFGSSQKFGPTRSIDRNFTVLASFGVTRQFALQDTRTKLPSGNFSLDLSDGTVLGLARDSNIFWRHGILKGGRSRDIPDDSQPQDRISVVLNGCIEQEEEDYSRE
jgi:hypothetical protein